MFGRLKKEITESTNQIQQSIEGIENENTTEVIENEQNITYNEANQMSEDLMRYIGEAIDKWSAMYGMESMPKNMVFKKVLTIMNAWDKTKVFR